MKQDSKVIYIDTDKTTAKLYADSPFDIGSKNDDEYRNAVDYLKRNRFVKQLFEFVRVS